jgi:RNA polymerase sigma factor (sigma-70 family)
MKELVERHRARVWRLCYRMMGDRASADDAAQESLARAIDRGGQASGETAEGWLFRVATNVCLDLLRRRAVERNAVALVDPLLLAEAPFEGDASPEETLLRREDLRFAMMTCLQSLAPRMRAVLVLRDVVDLSTEETARALAMTEENVKVSLHRARKKLDDAHRVGRCDPQVDPSLVDAFARCLESGDIDGLTRLFTDDVWGLVDDGAGKRKPTLGLRAVSRQWANAFGRYVSAERVDRIRVNGEPAILVVVGGFALALIHLETRDGRVAALRVVLDPPRLARLGLR